MQNRSCRSVSVGGALALLLGVTALPAQKPPAAGALPAKPPIRNPYVHEPPAVPEMTHMHDRLPVELMNRVFEPLPADAPPPSPDPRNLEGIWEVGESHVSRMRTTYTGRPTPLNDESARILTERINADNAGSPLNNAQSMCLPPGYMRILDLNFPFRIFQTPEQIDFVFEELHTIWQVRMNQPHKIPAKREYSGDSIGRWDGDTLVIENTGFKIPLWLDTAGAPLGPDGKITYRVRKIEGGKAMEIIATFEDPKYYTEPWSAARKFVWRPDRFLAEYNCEEQIGDDEAQAQLGISNGRAGQ